MIVQCANCNQFKDADETDQCDQCGRCFCFDCDRLGSINVNEHECGDMETKSESTEANGKNVLAASYNVRK